VQRPIEQSFSVYQMCTGEHAANANEQVKILRMLSSAGGCSRTVTMA